MADAKPTPQAAADSPQVAHLNFKRGELVKKLRALDGHKNSESHDIDNAKKRTQNGINEIDAELKQQAAVK